MSRRLRPSRLLALLVLAPVLLSACGESHSKVSGGTYAGESGANAPYLDVGQLVYEVQLSRELNPAQAPTQAPLMPYKIKTASLDNRPLTIKIVAPTDATQTASAELDV